MEALLWTAAGPPSPTWAEVWESARGWLTLHISREDATAFVVTTTVIVATVMVAVAASAWRPSQTESGEAYSESWTAVMVGAGRLASAAALTVSLGLLATSRTAGVTMCALSVLSLGIACATSPLPRGGQLQERLRFAERRREDVQIASKQFWADKPITITQPLSPLAGWLAATKMFGVGTGVGAAAGVVLVAVSGQGDLSNLRLWLVITLLSASFTALCLLGWWMYAATLLIPQLPNARRLMRRLGISLALAVLILVVLVSIGTKSSVTWFLPFIIATIQALLVWRGWQGRGAGRAVWRLLHDRDLSALKSLDERIRETEEALKEQGLSEPLKILPVVPTLAPQPTVPISTAAPLPILVPTTLAWAVTLIGAGAAIATARNVIRQRRQN